MSDESGPRPAGTISVIEPISRAMDWSAQVLFRPFRFEKWLVLGFCAWLALLGESGGGSGSSSWRDADDLPDVEQGMQRAWEWVLAHLLPILIVAGILVLLFLAIWLLVIWLSSRGKFMFVDGVVNDRAAVVEPWHRFRDLARSLFGFRILAGLLGFAALLAVLGFTALLVRSGLRSRDSDPLLIVAAVFAVLGIVIIALTFVLLRLAINDFLVPLMYLRGCPVGAAWRELGGLFSSRPGTFLLYVVARFGIGIAAAAITLTVCCLTCCIALLPYVGTVILLPLRVFQRAYPLYFLGQFGPRYTRFVTLGPDPPPPPGDRIRMKE